LRTQGLCQIELYFAYFGGVEVCIVLLGENENNFTNALSISLNINTCGKEMCISIYLQAGIELAILYTCYGEN
jgi:hypothetical protein